MQRITPHPIFDPGFHGCESNTFDTITGMLMPASA
jgi:hypothetical protein